jgi:23S rRNA (uracil1939-C5)-methyltransferase
LPARPYLVPVHRGDRRELAVESLGDGPDALAHVGGYVVFVAGALPDELVFAEITSSARKFGRARLLAVRTPSPDRVPAACRHFLHCGGCHWQHASYEAQLRYKQERVQKELAYALGDAPPAVQPTAPAPAPFGQRHKVALQLLPDHARGLLPALHPLRDHGLLPVQECPASEPAALRLAFAAVTELGRLRLPVFDAVTGTGLLRSVLVRRAAATGQAHLLIVATATDVPGLQRALPALRDAGASAISVNVNDGEPGRLLGPQTILLDGPRRIRDELDGTSYLISPDAFFQTSPQGALRLVRAVCDGLAPGPRDRVLDLYCGGGLFALQLARHAGEVLGIEESPTAVGDAIAAQKQNRLRNARFLQGPVEALLRRVRDGDLPQPTLAVLDPPRAGASPEALRQLAALAPSRIAYVACDPRALGRDLALLRDLGYRAQSVLPVDMFPQTAHVEAVAILERST